MAVPYSAVRAPEYRPPAPLHIRHLNGAFSSTLRGELHVASLSLEGRATLKRQFRAARNDDPTRRPVIQTTVPLVRGVRNQHRTWISRRASCSAQPSTGSYM